ncbi:hypothetical protein DVH24_016752 [Malus domestica]|uniref:Protein DETOXIFICATION n=1 Tax=Malus domestica TaxID=3750 RepID=A0A498HT57_MALDO|nr:hypothetical protein DVH24_016752 [Malus domestica]
MLSTDCFNNSYFTNIPNCYVTTRANSLSLSLSLSLNQYRKSANKSTVSFSLMGNRNSDQDGDLTQSLLPEALPQNSAANDRDQETELSLRVWLETKKLWKIVGPAIFSRVATFSMNVITQAFAGHLGEVELASVSIGITLVIGFNFGLLLGMASALETLCGQAFGAKRYHMLGIYLQRSWTVLFLCCIALLPVYIFVTPILKLLGQSDDVAALSGAVALWLIPLHFSFAFYFPLTRFLQSQLQNIVIAWVSLVALLINILTSWLFVDVLHFGVFGAVIALDISWWVLALGLYVYATCGWCSQTFTGFSTQAFSGLWEFIKLSVASGVDCVNNDLCSLENWYYRILILITGYLKNTTITVDALSVWYAIPCFI